MNVGRIKAITLKEFKEVVRDRIFLVRAFAMPIFIFTIFSVGVSFDVENVEFVLADLDQSPASRDFANAFIQSRAFKLESTATSIGQVEEMLLRGDVSLGVIIPHGFGKELAQGKSAEAAMLIDGTFPFRADTVVGYVSALTAFYNRDLLQETIRQAGGPAGEALERLITPVSFAPRYLYNEDLRSRNAMVPGVLAIVLLINPAILTAVSVAREKELGTIFNIYSSPTTKGEYFIGKLAPYLLIAYFNFFLLFLIGTIGFNVPFKGSFLFLAVASLLYVTITVGFGFLVSVFVRTQIAALVITALVALIPALLYSGLYVPLSSMSTVARIQAHLFPGMYYNRITTGTFLKDLGIAQLGWELLSLLLYGVVLFTLARLLFHKRTR